LAVGEQYTLLAEDSFWRGAALFGGAAIFGGVIGSMYLFNPRCSWRTRLLAPLVGILAGQIGLLILLAPGHLWRTVFAVGVLLVATLLLRLDAE
jgi:hypothetical protein